MFSTVLSATLRGLNVEFIQVEADTTNGLPMFHMVGYLSSEVKEAGERVRSAIRNTGILLPAKKMVVNLSPADVRKRGTLFDLPIALAILCSLGELNGTALDKVLVVGELGLDGAVKKVPGVLPIVFEAKSQGCKICIVPKENEKEGRLVKGIRVVGVESLKEAYDRISQADFQEQESLEGESVECNNVMDFADVHGQHLAKRAIEIAVAGNHGILMVGPPGAGKSMLAKRIPTILPPLSYEESMELTKIYSVVGELDPQSPRVKMRPFREVHQSITRCALIGGGKVTKPGEITFAHLGVLFLDEIAEFSKGVLELLRQPLQDHFVRIHREKGEYIFPSNFMFVAAMNPCPCGYYPDLNRCTCTTNQLQNYLNKISHPLLDRIDLCVEVEQVSYESLRETRREESSKEIQKRICKARERQKKRYEGLDFSTNGELSSKEIREYCKLGKKEEKIMKEAFEAMNLTARKYYKILAVARTIADLEEEEEIQESHLREALCFRMIDEKYWGGSV